MTLIYQSTLEDLAEPQIRLHLRGKTYPSQRLKESLWSVVGGSGAFYLTLKIIYDSTPLWWLCLLVGLLIGLVTFSMHKNTVSKRIRRYLNREYGDQTPYETVYEISETKLHCKWLGTEVTFNLTDLSEVQNDGKRLDLTFQKGSICSIPLRAFRDTSHQEEFVACVSKATSS